MNNLIYIFVGTVLPDSVRINIGLKIGREIKGEPDCPDGRLQVEISDNRIIASFITEETLTEVGISTVRNSVVDMAWSICDSVSLLKGAWTIVRIDTCIGPSGEIVATFRSHHSVLQSRFEEIGITFEQVFAINCHAQGFFFRLALTDLRFGLMDLKFLRSHLYRAVEALKQSVAKKILGAELNEQKDKQWQVFRDELDLKRSDIEQFRHNPERHGAYDEATPLTSAEIDQVFNGFVSLIAAYMGWFHKQYLTD